MIVNKILIINLDDKKERLDKVMNSLEKLNIKHYAERFAAHTRESDLFKQKKGMFCSYFCTNGMKGCASSHLATWQKIVDEDLNAAMILEDDVIFNDNFLELLDDFSKELPSDWDMVLLGCVMKCGMKKNYKTIESLHNILYDYGENERINDKILKLKNFIGAHAYILSNKGARKLLNDIELKTGHIDLDISDYLYNNPDFKAYVFSKEIALQTGSISDSSINAGRKPYLINHYLDKINVLDDRVLTLAYSLNEQSGAFEPLGLYLNLISVIFFIVGFLAGLFGAKLKHIIMFIFFSYTIEFLFLYNINKVLTFRDAKEYLTLTVIFIIGYLGGNVMANKQLILSRIKNVISH
jgi:GR25 family glycosyltransferase involved in LPS biosynthesis